MLGLSVCVFRMTGIDGVRVVVRFKCMCLQNDGDGELLGLSVCVFRMTGIDGGSGE